MHKWVTYRILILPLAVGLAFLAHTHNLKPAASIDTSRAFQQGASAHNGNKDLASSSPFATVTNSAYAGVRDNSTGLASNEAAHRTP